MGSRNGPWPSVVALPNRTKPSQQNQYKKKELVSSRFRPIALNFWTASIYAICRSPCYKRSIDAPNFHPYWLSSTLIQHLVGITLAIAEGIRELLERRSDELGLLPEVGGKEAVGVGDSGEGGLEGVLEGLGRAGRGGVGILDTGELEQTLDGGRGDKGGTAGGGDKLIFMLALSVTLPLLLPSPWNFGCRGTYADGDGTALAALLGGKRVGETEVGAPVTATNGDNAELSDDDGGTDGSSDFLGSLDAETDVALGVANDDDGLEAGTLTGTGLLLDGLDLFRG